MKDLTGLQLGKYYVIRKQYNPNVKVLQNNYWLVEVNGKQKLMRYDNILTFGKCSQEQMKHIPKASNKLSPKEAILKAIQSNDDIKLGALMLCCSLDIVNKLNELQTRNPESYFVPLHEFIEDYMNTQRYKSEVLNKSK